MKEDEADRTCEELSKNHKTKLEENFWLTTNADATKIYTTPKGKGLLVTNEFIMNGYLDQIMNEYSI